MLTAGMMIPRAALGAVAVNPIPPATLATMTGLGMFHVGAALAVAATVVLLVRVVRPHRAASRTVRLARTPEPRLAA